MRVLVTAASKHGATSGIAEAIADVLREHGLEVSVDDPGDVSSLEGVDAIVLGSAVYAGRWADDAVHFVDRWSVRLEELPVWVFSSGPVGDPPVPEEEPIDGRWIARAVRAEDHRVFAGRIDKSQLGIGERVVVRALRVPEGDMRDWDEIRDWGRTIARRLRSEDGRRLDTVAADTR